MKNWLTILLFTQSFGVIYFAKDIGMIHRVSAQCFHGRGTKYVVKFDNILKLIDVYSLSHKEFANFVRLYIRINKQNNDMVALSFFIARYLKLENSSLDIVHSKLQQINLSQDDKAVLADIEKAANEIAQIEKYPKTFTAVDFLIKIMAIIAFYYIFIGSDKKSLAPIAPNN